MHRPLFSSNTPVNTSNEDFGLIRKFNSTTFNEGYLNAFKKKKMLYSINKQNYMTNNTNKTKKLSLVTKSDMGISNNNSNINCSNSNTNTNVNVNTNANANSISVVKGEKQLINLDNVTYKTLIE